MTIESLRALRDHLSEVIDRVEHQHEGVTITRNGRDAADLISPEERVLYRLRDDTREVIVVRIEHRRRLPSALMTQPRQDSAGRE